MKFGISIPGLCLYPPLMDPWEPSIGSREFVRMARHADTLGFDWLTVPDHIFVTPEKAAVMGPRWCEGATTMAFLAGATRRIRVVSNVMVVAYRNPMILAQSLAATDFMSRGRVILGVGLGGSVPQEDQQFGVTTKERGLITDEYLQAMKAIWTQDVAAFKGRYVSFDDMVAEPKPVQKPYPPIWIGGNSRPAQRRAASLADGWMPWGVAPEQMPACLDYIRSQPGFAQRTRPFDVIMPATRLLVERDTHRPLGTSKIPETRDEYTEVIGANARAGGTGTNIDIGGTRSLEHYLERMEWFAREVMPSFKRKA